MIIGVLIWQGPTLVHSSTSDKQNSASTKAPVGTIASAAIAPQNGMAVPSKVIGDLTLKQAKENNLSTNRPAESKESQIFAIQYRIVRRRKRNAFRWPAPTLEDQGPRVERKFAGKDDDSRADSRHTGDDKANTILELDPAD